MIGKDTAARVSSSCVGFHEIENLHTKSPSVVELSPDLYALVAERLAVSKAVKGKLCRPRRVSMRGDIERSW